MENVDFFSRGAFSIHFEEHFFGQLQRIFPDDRFSSFQWSFVSTLVSNDIKTNLGIEIKTNSRVSSYGSIIDEKDIHRSIVPLGNHASAILQLFQQYPEMKKFSFLFPSNLFNNVKDLEFFNLEISRIFQKNNESGKFSTSRTKMVATAGYGTYSRLISGHQMDNLE